MSDEKKFKTVGEDYRQEQVVVEVKEEVDKQPPKKREPSFMEVMAFHSFMRGLDDDYDDFCDD